jgi:hypothetical protein
MSFNLFGVISERERASWAARSLVRWRREVKGDAATTLGTLSFID